MRVVLDIESNGLLNEADESQNATKLHCLCWHDIDTGESQSLTTWLEMVEFFHLHNMLKDLTIIGHKIITYDIPLLEKLLGIKIEARLIDTLGLSWYLYPERIKHGLDEWGQDLGIEKPPIDDWDNLPIEEYVHRCSEDVKINTKLFYMQLEYLMKIYNNDLAAVGRFMDYISFKLDCAREQEEVKLRLDVEKCKTNLIFLQGELTKKFDILSKIMPTVNTYKIKSKPKEMYKKDGSISSHGQKWLDLLKAEGLPEYHLGALKLVDKTLPGNPGSHQQLKNWLFSLGWVPTTFKYVKDTAKKEEGDNSYTAMNKGTTRAIPQLSADDGSGICPSVKDLYDENPQLIELEDMFVIKHRIGILEGFLEKVNSQDLLKAEIAGFTNTLRFKHSKPIVNLPATPKKYWEMVRGVLIAPNDDYFLCGWDMSGLEDNCKQHYMYFFDPQYVMEMRTPGFDAHIDIATLGKAMSWEEGEFYKWYDHKKEGKEYVYTEPKETVNRFDNNILEVKYSFEALISLPDDLQAKIIKKLKPIRLKSKKTNFAAVYGAGVPKLALTANITEKEAKALHTTYWTRNKAVKLVAANTIRKTIDGNMWLYNPVSKFWYSLRIEKDAFSTLNQSTGVYCFDIMVKHVRMYKIRQAMQYHDEGLFPLRKENVDKARVVLNECIAKVNEEIKLNIPLSISMDFGSSYSAVH